MAGADFKSVCEAAAPSLVCSIHTRPRQIYLKLDKVLLFIIYSYQADKLFFIILSKSFKIKRGKGQ